MARIVRIHEYGGPEVLRYEPWEEKPPGPGQVVIQVKAIGINRSEIMFRSGGHLEVAHFPARLGYEAAGLVRAIGDGVARLAVGDAVSVVPPISVTRWGTYGEVATLPAQFVVKHPRSLSWEEAAATWMANITAYGALVDVARLAPGEAVVILAASSSVGLAAIQVARLAGALVVATTRGPHKRQALLDHGAHHVIVTETEDVAAQVLALTGGRGARVVMDPVSGPGVTALARAMSHFGMLIEYGHLEPEPPPLPIGELIAKGLSVRGFTMKEIVSDPARLEAAKRYVLDGVEQGVLTPTIAKVFGFEEIAEAHVFMQSNGHVGKVVVVV